MAGASAMAAADGDDDGDMATGDPGAVQIVQEQGQRQVVALPGVAVLRRIFRPRTARRSIPAAKKARSKACS
jgi:hypothetical protein